MELRKHGIKHKNVSFIAMCFFFSLHSKQVSSAAFVLVSPPTVWVVLSSMQLQRDEKVLGVGGPQTMT